MNLSISQTIPIVRAITTTAAIIKFNIVSLLKIINGLTQIYNFFLFVKVIVSKNHFYL